MAADQTVVELTSSEEESSDCSETGSLLSDVSGTRSPSAAGEPDWHGVGGEDDQSFSPKEPDAEGGDFLPHDGTDEAPPSSPPDDQQPVSVPAATNTPVSRPVQRHCDVTTHVDVMFWLPNYTKHKHSVLFSAKKQLRCWKSIFVWL